MFDYKCSQSAATLCLLWSFVQYYNGNALIYLKPKIASFCMPRLLVNSLFKLSTKWFYFSLDSHENRRLTSYIWPDSSNKLLEAVLWLMLRVFFNIYLNRVVHGIFKGTMPWELFLDTSQNQLAPKNLWIGVFTGRKLPLNPHPSIIDFWIKQSFHFKFLKLSCRGELWFKGEIDSVLIAV